MNLTFRVPGPADRAGIIRAFGDEPTEEQLAAAAGDRAGAQRYRSVVARVLVTQAALARTVVAADEAGAVVGFAQWGSEAGERVTLPLAWGVLRTFGPLGVRGFLRRDRLRAKVAIPAPANTFHIAEIHVAAEMRGQGIGAALLEQLEREGRARGASRLSLTTATNNPARRLYERAGFRVTETRTDPEFEAATGVAGRVLMVKVL